ncbi:helix-turn-helix transcriptional regulator [Fluviicola sp.]|uniref:helix-turn-helix domain-containing protein n=1 Tax=Fluviicola sp. TaxID=1917219 RepID=UPI00283A8CFB|nr:helix-turn-helix transcriptional regulator [Fluviicola sp.]
MKKIRTEKGLTQEELSYKSELDISQIGRIERGLVNTSISVLNKIANALQIELKELFDFETN